MIFLIVGTWLMNQWLIPIYGITGSAIATASIILIFNVFRTIFVWIAFGMFPFSVKNIAVIFIAIAVFGLTMMIPTFPAIGKIPSFMIDTPIRSLIVSIHFGSAIYFSKISSDVNQLVDGLLKKVIR